ncbi:TMV resistance protein N [Linum grandiflorum]
MAASSYSTPYTGEWEYDVFLCFRGDDTRDGFTGHLLSALSDKKIRTFIDNMLAKTESIDELISILQRCALSVVVFSEKFADSIWCLEEVVTIARRMTEFGHRVLPVFYKVDPYDVTGNSRSYATTMDREYKSRSTYVEDKKKWMDALKAVANSSGHTSQNIKIESELIKAIVDDVQKQLIDMSPSIKSAHLVGMGSRILEVERLLAMDTLDDTRIIGLWGMGGVGKTTLAKACYERITSSNKGINHHFIGSIGEKCGKGHGVEEVVNELYSELLSENNINRQDLDIIYRRGRLSRSRVFIVLDNVETPLQLEQILLGEVAMNLENLFAPGSKIIVTTRDKRVLDYAKAMIYNVADLDDSESIQLFSLRALRKHHPPPDWEGISCLATSYCKGNPLTLRVLGGILFNQDKYYWQSFLSELKLIQSPEIHDIVERSCNKLGAEEKRIFLDVACFLHGISITQLIVYMSTVYPSAYAKVKNLIDGTLLVCEGEKIEVHDLLKEMAWHIVNKEPKLGKRSRNLKRLPPKLDSKLLNHVRMCGCRKVAHCPEIISRELVEFDLNDTSLDELPNAIYNVKQDGTLRLSGENITKFPVITTSLQRLWLSHTSIREIDLHDYHQTSSKIVLPRFELLYFVDNQQLKSLSKSIWNMVSHELVINGSPLIETLPEISEPVTVLASLQIRECGSLKSLPSSISNITSLKSLELLETGIKSLPSSIQELRELYHINLRFCKSLETMPSSIYKLSNLLKLTVSRCESIRSLPELPPNLVKLDVNGCKSLQALPSNTSKLKHLKILHFEECPQLDQAIPVDIVANFLVRASLSLSPQHREVVCSRSELPDWFTYRSMNLKDEENCSVKVELSLPHDGDQPMVMKGIAFGLVFSSDSLVYLRCDCKFGNTIVAYWPSKSLGFFSGDDSSEILSLVVNMHSSGVRAVGSEEEEEACCGPVAPPCSAELMELKRRMHLAVYPVGGLVWSHTEGLGMKLLRKRGIPDEKHFNAFLDFGPEESFRLVSHG